MKKFFIGNYNSEELKLIIKMNKLLEDSHKEISQRRYNNIEKSKDKTLTKDRINKILSELDDKLNLTSIINKEMIIDIIIKCEGNEDKIIEEIEKYI